MMSAWTWLFVVESEMQRKESVLHRKHVRCRPYDMEHPLDDAVQANAVIVDYKVSEVFEKDRREKLRAF